MTYFDRESTAAQVIDGHDLHGRNAVVTGGTGGLGLETALALASSGARVLITGREQAKGEATVRRLRELTGNPEIDFETLDLASLTSVTRFTRRYTAAGRPLHLLINNAGTLTTSLSYTEDGFESQFGANHLGHFALTIGLLAALRAAAGARVIVLSSRAHRRGDVDFDDPNYRARDYDAMQAYGQSKTANALFAVGLTSRHGDHGITANAVMPGMVMTDLARHMSEAQIRAMGWPRSVREPVAAPGWKSAAQGAATTVWAAVAPELDGVGGRYLEDCAIGQPWATSSDLPTGHYRPYALDANRADRLWSLSESLLAS